MLIGIPKETHAGESRVAATPQTVGQLVKLGYEVVVEGGAGALASLSDEAFVEAGARMGEVEDVWGADIVLKVNPPNDTELAMLRDGATLIGLLNPRLDPEMVDKLAARKITALSMDAVPRISRAQSMDVLSSMANIAGYRAIVEAAHEFGRFFTGQVTAAGKVPPAKVFVAGAGVAGLAAIGAAGAMGAIVRANDVRPEVAEQVESMGAEFVSVEDPTRGGQHRRLRQGNGRRLPGQADGDVRRAVQGRRHHHHHRTDPGPARAPTDHGRDGPDHEARQRDRRHGRADGWQRRRHRRG